MDGSGGGSSRMEQVKLWVGELGELADYRWMLATLSLLLAVPWVLFMGPAVTGGYESVTVKVLFGVFQIAFAASIFAATIATGAAADLKGPLSDVGAFLFAAGIALLAVGSGEVVDVGASCSTVCAVAGSAFAAVGYGLLACVWCFPFSRIEVGQSVVCAALSMVIGTLLYLVASAFLHPFGSIALAIACLAVFPAARRKVRGHVPAPFDLAGSISHADVFVLSNKRKLYLLFALSYFTFGGCVIDFVNGRVGFDLMGGSWAVPLLAVVVLLVVMWAARSRRRSVLMTLLSASVCCTVIGSVVASYDDLYAAGYVLLITGFIMLSVFYVAYFSGICKRRDFSDARSLRILGRTVLVAPASFLLTALLSWVCNEVVPSHAHIVVVISQAALLVVFVLMFYDEVTRTRQELARKMDSAITLRDIRQFALESGEEYRLTDRECEIIRLLMGGRSVSAAAKELYLSESTVKTHIRSIYKKLGVHNRQEMIELVNKRLGC